LSRKAQLAFGGVVRRVFVASRSSGEREALDRTAFKSDNQMVAEISATDASKRFADLLDAVEHRGETFTVVRRGRVVATIAPARSGSGADLRRILTEHPPDDRWADDLRDLRRFAGDAPVADPWND
jgi:prevent-host-death family protein